MFVTVNQHVIQHERQTYTSPRVLSDESQPEAECRLIECPPAQRTRWEQLAIGIPDEEFFEHGVEIPRVP